MDVLPGGEGTDHSDVYLCMLCFRYDFTFMCCLFSLI